MGNETSDTSTESTQTESNEAAQTKQESVNKSTEKKDDKNDANKKEEKRPCCVCKETRAARDLCYAEKGFEECYKEIQQHKDCMASEGFKI